MKAWEFHEEVRKSYSGQACGDFEIRLVDKKSGDYFTPTSANIHVLKDSRVIAIEIEPESL